MMKQLILVVLFLAGFFVVGKSLQCWSCHGSQEHCSSAAEEVECSPGQTMCAKFKVEKEGKEDFTYGCAGDEDCESLKEVCSPKMYGNSGTSCPTYCCNSSKCNNPEPADNSFKCFQCESAKSMDDCDLYSQPVACPADQNRCASISTKMTVGDNTVMTYRKGCRMAKECEAKSDVFLQACEKDDDCNMDCCSNELCNAASYSSVSALTTFLYLVLAVFL